MVIKEGFSFLAEMCYQHGTLEPLKPRLSLKLCAREGGQNNMPDRLHINCSVVFHSSSKTFFF